MPSVKKTWLIDAMLVQRTRKICGARTETETVTRVLQDILVRNEIDTVFRRVPRFSQCPPEEGWSRYT
jgi:hypothetical protein